MVQQLSTFRRLSSTWNVCVRYQRQQTIRVSQNANYTTIRCRTYEASVPALEKASCSDLFRHDLRKDHPHWSLQGSSERLTPFAVQVRGLASGPSESEEKEEKEEEEEVMEELRDVVEEEYLDLAGDKAGDVDHFDDDSTYRSQAESYVIGMDPKLELLEELARDKLVDVLSEKFSCPVNTLRYILRLAELREIVPVALDLVKDRDLDDQESVFLPTEGYRSVPVEGFVEAWSQAVEQLSENRFARLNAISYDFLREFVEPGSLSPQDLSELRGVVTELSEKPEEFFSWSPGISMIEPAIVTDNEITELEYSLSRMSREQQQEFAYLKDLFMSEDPGLPPLQELLADDIDEEEEFKEFVDREAEEQAAYELRHAPKMDANGVARSVGKRKASTCTLSMWKVAEDEEPEITVNGKYLNEYFPVMAHRGRILTPFRVTNTMGRYSWKANIHGGGVTGQADALTLAIARCLQNIEGAAIRPPLKMHGLMTRDPRIVERKKPGLRKARRAFQWVKR
mmetsp:Transcript_6331/g.7267  ORF Transcript_6331/g.7267 Transcript_6331/m.7267 type:complete len:512 (+) Transcript_6331:293-1828(+)|eukprot:CAMPEP_0197859062 /NCGR_PEP_ID=MMETSP1438-20131217/33373_1 /TAXON_ID=1461541 /ORGANISM="Pterosperma sp., Strain CCMP1384" /LENGTH=511 /DNA_ID=CAMNT_0043475445 /DNA_START=241 /DNA_END=1776 /DNA_ORIENTATION=+